MAIFSGATLIQCRQKGKPQWYTGVHGGKRDLIRVSLGEKKIRLATLQMTNLIEE